MSEENDPEETLLPSSPEGSPGFFPETVLHSSRDLAVVEQALRQGLQRRPDDLASHFALYKLLFRQFRLAEAEQAAHSALSCSARLGGFDPRWEQLGPHSADWSAVQSPAHFYLFTLKALGFILLRRHAFDGCRQILDKLQELDPQDSVGFSVIRAYADGAATGAR